MALPMTKPKQQGLFHELADADQQRGFMTKDEREYEKARKRQSRHKKNAAIPSAPPTGPACLRCKRWRKPVDDDKLGFCAHLIVSGERLPRLQIESGDVLPYQQAERIGLGVWDYLRTGEAFSCSSYLNIALEGEAA